MNLSLCDNITLRHLHWLPVHICQRICSVNPLRSALKLIISIKLWSLSVMSCKTFRLTAAIYTIKLGLFWLLLLPFDSPFIWIDWLSYSTSTQKGQFVPTVGEGNWLSGPRMANEMQCILPYVTRYHRNTIHSKTRQLVTCNNPLSNRMTNLLIITLAPSLVPSQVSHILFHKISLGVDAV